MLNKIEEIAMASGNEKIEVMKKYPELKEVLRYAYDPFKKYHITAPDIQGYDYGGMMGNLSFFLLDSLSERSLSGNMATEEVTRCIKSLNQDSAEVFKRILNKDLRAGINIKSINKAFPGLIDMSRKPDIMLVKNFNPKKIKYPCLAAVKKDGVRAREIGEEFISRPGNKLIGMDHITDDLKYFAHELDGELVVPGKIFDVASGLIRSNDPTPNAVYWIFDIPSVIGTKLERYKELKKYENLFSEHIKIIPHVMIQNKEQLDNFYELALYNGEEGIVIYDPDSLYEDGRTNAWMRMVPLEQADCKVIGFYEGKGKHEFSLGGIIVDYKGHEVKVGTGFKEKDWDSLSGKQKEKEGDKLTYTDKLRQYIWNNKQKFFEVIAQCEYKEETKAGSMRQPRFKHWRWDK